MRYIIRSVPERERWLPEITAQIPHLEVVRDFSRNAMDTFLLAFLHAEDDAAVHLEDDIELTSDFPAKVEAAIAERPHQVINFFSRRKDDLTKGSRLMAAHSSQNQNNFMYTVCFYLPPGYTAAIHAYYPSWPRRLERHADGWIDTIVGDWLNARGERYWLHVPSLVQHRDSPSIIGRRPPKRQSATFQH